MSVRVVARIRPLLEKEQDKDVIVRAEAAEPGKMDTIVKIPNPRNESEEFSFAFNAVYDQTTSQEALFTAEVSQHVKSLFHGYDVTIFAYGVTGTGKTHTMRGGLKLAERGVIPRMLSGIFRRGKKIMKDSEGETEVKVLLSYYEIYNDKVYDLLEPPEKRTASGLPLRAEASGKTVVAGLSERPCQDLKDFEKMYIEANNNRVTAATKLNAHSSRSHAILRVKLIQITGDRVKESTASAIDLAGSEDNRRTDNGKERLVESAAINKSLFVLSQCINAISNGDKRIPYRESKMTRILSLGQNNGITVMILNLAPMRSYHLDTLSSLNVSSRAKRIEVREIENEVVFKQFPKTTSQLTNNGTQRQPLRPLANAHNVSSANNATKPAAVERPVKAFQVFTDKTNPAVATSNRPAANSSEVRRSSSNKRISDHEPAPRSQKMARSAGQILHPGGAASTRKLEGMTVSAADIEAMVEKKVTEILAAKSAAEKSVPPPSLPVQPDLSEEVQKRLEALERRIDDDWRDEARSEGLRCLLAARTAKERGDDATALKMYEMALPYFPGQVKLLGKIERLRARLEGSAPGSPSPRSPAKSPRKLRKRRMVTTEPDDGDYATAEADTEEEVEKPHFEPGSVSSRKRRSREVKTWTDDEEVSKQTTKNKNKKTKTKRSSTNATILSGDEGCGPASPKTQHLLDIVNSRELIQIRGLVGFGAKKAKDLVDYLEMVSGEGEGSGQIETLSQLRAVPGMGSRTVERAYEGLVV